MKTFIKYIILLMIFILIISCEDDLNPFIKGEDVFIVNCILKNDRGVQTVYLSKNYQAENFDPKSNTEDHSIGNGFVRVFFKDSVKIFSDTLVTQNIDGNEKSFNSYINSNFLTKPNTEYELEAVLNDGRKLRAFTKTPNKVSFIPDSNNIIPPPDKNYISVGWSTVEDQLYSSARFKFIYFKNEDGKQVRYEKEVPRTYVLENNVYVPYYPVPSYLQRINVEMIAFDRAMAEISEGDPDKKNYTILTFILEILVYDKNLTAYYASRSELGESFAITTNESDYTNISGGRGIFGSFIKQRFAVRFTHEYIKSFGYEPGLTSSINE